jgi:hypothetical protein
MEYDSTCNRAFESACVKAWRPNLPPALPQPPSITIPHNHKHKHNPPQRTPTNPSTHFYSNHPHPAGMLRGPFHTPANHTAQTCLSALLTHSLAARLAEGEPQPLAPHSNPCHPPPPPSPPPPHTHNTQACCEAPSTPQQTRLRRPACQHCSPTHLLRVWLRETPAPCWCASTAAWRQLRSYGTAACARSLQRWEGPAIQVFRVWSWGVQSKG